MWWHSKRKVVTVRLMYPPSFIFGSLAQLANVFLVCFPLRFLSLALRCEPDFRNLAGLDGEPGGLTEKRETKRVSQGTYHFPCDRGPGRSRRGYMIERIGGVSAKIRSVIG